MKSLAVTLSLLLASISFCAVAGPPGFAQVGDQRLNEVRDAVEAHQGARPEHGAAGRRLSPAELAELRSQVRQQWGPRPEVFHSGDSLPPARNALTAPRSQRP